MIKPLEFWNDIFRYRTCSEPYCWYKAYNAVKHNRDTKFEQANMKNLLEAVAGLFCILYAQFGSHIAEISIYADEEDEPNLSQPKLEGIIFTIEPYTSWSESERYNFDWKTLKQIANPFEQFDFNQQV